MIETLGRYQIEAEIGHGAMGTVYKARDPLLGRVVAIKTISLHLPKDEVAEYEARFYQEAKAAGQLSHSNIVTIYDIGKSDDLAYMAMEYLEGQELRQMLSADTLSLMTKASPLSLIHSSIRAKRSLSTGDRPLWSLITAKLNSHSPSRILRSEWTLLFPSPAAPKVGPDTKERRSVTKIEEIMFLVRKSHQI